MMKPRLLLFFAAAPVASLTVEPDLSAAQPLKFDEQVRKDLSQP